MTDIFAQSKLRVTIGKLNKNSCTRRLDSAVRPVLHSYKITVPVFKELLSRMRTRRIWRLILSNMISDVYFEEHGSTTKPQCFNQAKLNNLLRDLSLSKELSELLALRLNENNLLQHDTNETFYRIRVNDILPYFRVASNLFYCHNVSGLLNAIDVTPYDPNEWRLY